MPGYTHHQPGMIGSWGHLLFSYALALERDVRRFADWYALFNYNPLGGAAGYGTRLPLDRKLTARLMGFDGVHESSLDPAHNRWEPEAELGYGISVMMNHLSNLAQTLIVLSTSEFGMVRLDDAYCTGSSLMPQKRNPDPLEVIKGKAAFAQGMLVALLTLGRSLFAGYNRESQWSKYPLMDVIDECKPSLAVMKELIASLTFNGEAALACCTKAFIAATDVVEWLVQAYAVPFRKAKSVVEKAVIYSEEQGAVSDRAGGDGVFEVYPAAALARWGLASRGYRGDGARPRRAALLRGLTQAHRGSASARVRREPGWSTRPTPSTR